MKKPYGTYPAEIAAPYIAEWEGMRSEAYQDAVGVWTIGCGHTKDVKPGDVVTRAEAMMMLVEDLKETIDGLMPHVKVDVTEGQFVALTSIAFNVGVEGLVGGCPKLMAALNAGKWKECAKEFLDVDHAGGKKIPGLTRRRREEADLFLRDEK